MRVALAFAVAALVACAPPAVAPNRAHARAALVQLTFAAHSAAKDCTATARGLAARKGVELGAEGRANRLVDVCVNGLIPPRDALHFAAEAADPWTPEATDKITCAAKATAVALSDIREAIRNAGGRTSAVVDDAIVVGEEIGAAAGPECDPRHPTTTITVTIDPHMAPEPDPQAWP